MNAGLPLISGRELVRALCRLGYTVRDQKGSHIHLRHPVRRPLTVPDHPEIARGTLRVILRDAGLTAEELRDQL
jgi:predicted RNA binding protein YcfA (HicA-like mRNA interferase family)